MPTRRHRQKREQPPNALDLLSAYRAASDAYYFGEGSRENYEAAKAAWEAAKERLHERERARKAATVD